MKSTTMCFLSVCNLKGICKCNCKAEWTPELQHQALHWPLESPQVRSNMLKKPKSILRGAIVQGVEAYKFSKEHLIMVVNGE